MPNLKDVFDAVTKNEQHDPDGWSDLERRQRHALRRRRTGAYVAAAVILAIAIVAAGAIVRNPDTGSPAGQTPTPSPPLLGEAMYLVSIVDYRTDPFTLSTGPGEGGYWFRYSPDGTRVTFTLGADDATNQIWMSNADGSDLRKLTDEPKGADGAEWSPDGSALVYQQTGPGDLAILDLATGDSHRIVRTPPGEPAQLPSWRPDGQEIAYEQFGAVRTVNLATGRTRQLLGTAGEPEWSPDGTQIAFESAGIALANGDGSERRAIDEGASKWPAWSPDGSLLAYNRYSQAGTRSDIWLYDVATGERRLFLENAEQVGWKDAGTLITQGCC